MRKKQKKVLTASIKPLLIKLTIPSIFGILGIMVFNLTDTFFVAKLGTNSLAAISFTFPVVILVSCFSLGLGTAVMSLFSKAVGSHDIEKEKHLATSALILAVLLATLIAAVGFLTIDPLFTCLGAGSDLMPDISAYMKIWYLGSVFVVFPMIGDHILRGLGDTKTPAFVMLTCAVFNLILDPLLIFGIGPFPHMGITGAALATVIARMLTMFFSFWIIACREKLISFQTITFNSLIKEWKSILYIGLPNSIVKMIVPISIGVFTAILAKYGNIAVAGYGVATKIEGVALTVAFALSITAAVFTGQNLGAKNYDRVKKGILWLVIYSLCVGVVIFVFFSIFGKYLGGYFNDDPQIKLIVGKYLFCVSIGYGFYAITQIVASILNILHKPFLASFISIFQIFIINVPLAFLLSTFWKEQGIFVSIAISYIVTGCLSLVILKNQINKLVNVKKVTREN